MRAAVFLGAGVVVGAAVGFVVGRASKDDVVVAAPAVEHADVDPDDNAPSGSGSGAPSGSGTPTTRTPANPLTTTENGPVTVERVRALEAEVRRLRASVEGHELAVKETEGMAIAFPEGRTAAADQEQLMTTLQASLKARGLEGEISAIDCSEFPCIAHGGIQGIHDDALNAVLKDAETKLGGLPYAGVNRFINNDDPSTAKTTFSIALFPKDLPEAEQQNLNKRLRARKNAYVDAAHD